MLGLYEVFWTTPPVIKVPLPPQNTVYGLGVSRSEGLLRHIRVQSESESRSQQLKDNRFVPGLQFLFRPD